MPYVGTMQCFKCGYIVFKSVPKCGNCGFNFKQHASSRNQHLDTENMFTIFAVAGAEAGSSAAEAATEHDLAVQESAGGMDQGLFESAAPAEDFASTEMDSAEDLFELDLSEAVAFDTPAMMENPYGMGSFDPAGGGDFPLNEIEVEGLGFVPMDDAAPTESEPEEAVQAEPEAVLETPEAEMEIAEPVEEEDALEQETGDIQVETDETDVEIEMPEDLDDSEHEIALDIDDEIADEAPVQEEQDEMEDDASIAVDEIELDTDLAIDEPQEEATGDIGLQPDLELDETDLEIDPDLQLEDLSFDGEAEDDIFDGDLPADMDLAEPDLAIDDLGLELEDSDEDPENPDEEKQP